MRVKKTENYNSPLHILKEIGSALLVLITTLIIVFFVGVFALMLTAGIVVQIIQAFV